MTAVQPRSRGEHGKRHNVQEMVVGSAPLARGTPGVCPGRQGDRRFSPARAGNTGGRSQSAAVPPVQPRSRGEHGVEFSAPTNSYGSAPLARGTRAWHDANRLQHRFSPARAGNTAWPVWIAAGTSVQPRSRGEHCSPRSNSERSNGSAPLARGTLVQRRAYPFGERFSPARAGNTPTILPNQQRLEVQPRSRGEHPTTRIDRSPNCGSAPLARGTHLRGTHDRDKGRFSPARAGNTMAWSARAGTSTVQPRSRGEHTEGLTRNPASAGSAPLARGTLLSVLGAGVKVRFSPARAGNTRYR